jgi:hypothetical protein
MEPSYSSEQCSPAKNTCLAALSHSRRRRCIAPLSSRNRKRPETDRGPADSLPPGRSISWFLSKTLSQARRERPSRPAARLRRPRSQKWRLGRLGGGRRAARGVVENPGGAELPPADLPRVLIALVGIGQAVAAPRPGAGLAPVTRGKLELQLAVLAASQLLDRRVLARVEAGVAGAKGHPGRLLRRRGRAHTCSPSNRKPVLSSLSGREANDFARAAGFARCPLKTEVRGSNPLGRAKTATLRDETGRSVRRVVRFASITNLTTIGARPTDGSSIRRIFGSAHPPSCGP